VSSTVAAIISSERRKRLKRIVVSEQNYLALKKLGHAGDSFNDVISKLLRIQRNYQEKRQQELQQQQQKSDNGNNNINSSNSGLPFSPSFSEMLSW